VAQHQERSIDVRTAREWAVDKLPRHFAEQSQIINGLFEARERQREEVRRAKEQSKLNDHRTMLTDRFDVEPLAQRMLLMMHDARRKNPARAAKAYTQFVIFSNAAGFDQDVEIPEEEENGPVFDRSTAGRHMKAFKPKGHTQLRLASTSSAPKYPKELEDYILAKLRNGIEPRQGEGAGRPTNDWKVAEYNARLRYEQEVEDAQANLVHHNEEPVNAGPEQPVRPVQDDEQDAAE
jgi:hypothetical protein